MKALIKKHNVTLAAIVLFAVITFVAIAAPQVLTNIIKDILNKH